MIVPLFALANAGRPHRRGAAVRRGHVAGHARHPLSATWSASRSGPRAAWLASRSAVGPAPGAQLAGARGRRRRRGHRLHGLAADRHHGLRGPASSTRPSSACWPRRSSPPCSPGSIFRVIRELPAEMRARQLGHRDRRASSTSPTTSTRSATTSAARGRPGHAAGVRRLRVPVLRPGRGRDPRRCSTRSATTALRLAPPAAERRPPERAARRRGRRGRRRAGRFWEMHDRLLDHQDALMPPTCALRGRARAGPRPLLGGPAPPRLRRARRRGRRQRRRERRGRHPDVLHQRARHGGAYDIDTLAAAVRRARKVAQQRRRGVSGFLTGRGRLRRTSRVGRRRLSPRAAGSRSARRARWWFA